MLYSNKYFQSLWIQQWKCSPDFDQVWCYALANTQKKEGQNVKLPRKKSCLQVLWQIALRVQPASEICSKRNQHFHTQFSHLQYFFNFGNDLFRACSLLLQSNPVLVSLRIKLSQLTLRQGKSHATFLSKRVGGKSQLAENKTCRSSCLDSPSYKFLGQVECHVSFRPSQMGF